ncbi:MAG TPA: DUF3576 domain-containing protein [Alphaproteobacteria bacterium]|nr:DUF3576 domain-containing protein [Alphaproteobacteria bacterium]
MIRLAILAFLIPAIAVLSACSGGEAKYPTGAERSATGANNIYDEAPSIFGDDGMGIFGEKKATGPGENGVSVNGYLWRAALDTVSFMPLASADPFGGTIITDWYTDPSTPSERTKLNVFILGRELKADALSVKIFRQTKSGASWSDAPVAADTGRKMEDAILTRAREMRITQER